MIWPCLGCAQFTFCQQRRQEVYSEDSSIMSFPASVWDPGLCLAVVIEHIDFLVRGACRHSRRIKVCR